MCARCAYAHTFFVKFSFFTFAPVFVWWYRLLLYFYIIFIKYSCGCWLLAANRLLYGPVLPSYAYTIHTSFALIPFIACLQSWLAGSSLYFMWLGQLCCHLAFSLCFVRRTLIQCDILWVFDFYSTATNSKLNKTEQQKTEKNKIQKRKKTRCKRGSLAYNKFVVARKWIG